MPNIQDRCLTYSVLAQIRSNSKLVNGTIDLFVPLVKRILAILEDKGVTRGESIMEIQKTALNQYGIDFPIPVLRRILNLIAKQINRENEIHFSLHQDDSFQIMDYAFAEFEDVMDFQKAKITELKKLFAEFCSMRGDIKSDETSVLDFIESNRFSLSKYLAHGRIDISNDFSIEAQFVDYFKNTPSVYETIRSIYLGSILVGYIEYKTEDVKTGVELIFDTNFLLGLLDLNTPESTHTCKKIVEITRLQGYILGVLPETIEEAKGLLRGRAREFNKVFLYKKLYREDVYNACDRRKLTAADLERIADNFALEISSFHIQILPESEKLRNKARYSDEFEFFKDVRPSFASALHDAMTLQYVKEKRGKRIREFEDVNCWLINNNVTRDKYALDLDEKLSADYQPESIRADDFLNILWLSNPQIQSDVSATDIADIGMSSLVSTALTSSLPKLSIIREIDNNMQRYLKEGKLTDKDVVRIATRITTRQIKDMENLAKSADTNNEYLVQRLNEESEKQREQDEETKKRLENALQDYSQQIASLSEMEKRVAEKLTLNESRLSFIEAERNDQAAEAKRLINENETLKNTQILLEKRNRALQREQHIDRMIARWQKSSKIEVALWVLAFLSALFGLLWYSNWNINTAIEKYRALKSDLIIGGVLVITTGIFTYFSLRKLYDTHYNHSNIENYKKGLKLPENLNE